MTLHPVNSIVAKHCNTMMSLKHTGIPSSDDTITMRAGIVENHFQRICRDMSQFGDSVSITRKLLLWYSYPNVTIFVGTDV